MTGEQRAFSSKRSLHRPPRLQPLLRPLASSPQLRRVVEEEDAARGRPKEALLDSALLHGLSHRRSVGNSVGATALCCECGDAEAMRSQRATTAQPRASERRAEQREEEDTAAHSTIIAHLHCSRARRELTHAAAVWLEQISHRSPHRSSCSFAAMEVGASGEDVDLWLGQSAHSGRRMRTKQRTPALRSLLSSAHLSPLSCVPALCAQTRSCFWMCN